MPTITLLNMGALAGAITAAGQSLVLKTNVGSPIPPANIAVATGAYSIAAIPGQLLGTNDQFSFAYETVSGDA